VPAYIALVPPPNWSGTVSGVTAEVWSGETGLDQTVNSANFDVTFNGVADGILISPTLSFGNEGQVVLLNLNSAMPDMDGSETAIITVKGLGSFAAFYAGSTLLSRKLRQRKRYLYAVRPDPGASQRFGRDPEGWQF
jgi:hypothetical protein